MHRRIPYLVILILMFLAGALCAQEVRIFNRTVQAHGFFTQGFVYTDENNWLSMNTSRGSFGMTDMGLNVSSQVTDDHLLEDLRKEMRQKRAGLGIATDGDADRFGIVDSDGTFLQPNYIIALLFDYLVESRGWKNGVAKSVATTNLINALAEKHDVDLHETPVGFKYIGELIMQDKIAIGGEESAGLSIRHHVPEKDGILAGLLCCEMMARRGKSLGEQLKSLCNQVGSYYPRRENFRLTPEVKQKFTEKLAQDPHEFSGRRVSQAVRTDGLKLVLDDGSWVCYRLSGTEPVVRVYSEARSESGLEKLSAAAKQWIFE